MYVEMLKSQILSITNNDNPKQEQIVMIRDRPDGLKPDLKLDVSPPPSTPHRMYTKPLTN